MGEVAIGVRVGGAATKAVVCDVKINDQVTRTSCVSNVSDIFEISPL